MNITKSNCNYHIKRICKELEQLGVFIDKACSDGRIETVMKVQKEIESKNDILSQLLEFRRFNDCLIEGDPGYGPV